MGLLQRGPKGESIVRTEVVPNTRRRNLQQHIRRHVVMDGETTLYSDALKSYEPKTPKGWMPSDLYIHKVIDHAEAYVNGEVHTNSMENFWSLLKRMIKGTYVSVEPAYRPNLSSDLPWRAIMRFADAATSSAEATLCRLRMIVSPSTRTSISSPRSHPTCLRMGLSKVRPAEFPTGFRRFVNAIGLPLSRRCYYIVITASTP